MCYQILAALFICIASVDCYKRKTSNVMLLLIPMRSDCDAVSLSWLLFLWKLLAAESLTPDQVYTCML